MEREDLLLVGVVAVAHAWQLGMAATEVAVLRRKHKINPPETNGPPDFIRALRAQQNCLEFGVPFQIALWTAGIFGHQAPAALFGCYYLFARHKYIKGYIRSPDDSMAQAQLQFTEETLNYFQENGLKPFYHSIRALKGLLAVVFVGMGNIVLKRNFDIDVFSALKEKVLPS